ncbi:MAG: hypothetical protein PVH00_06205 [Gemmatimonadota bacterium]|jgi:hypothetical protein
MTTLRTGETLADVHAAAELSDDSARFLKPERAPRDYVQILIRNRLYEDAIGLIAHVLPPREGVWWAWSCARDAAGESPPEPVTRALETTRSWIVEPTDENRRAAGEVAEELDYDSAPAFAAFAAFLCGETLGPADAAPAPPPPGASGKAIAGCICMAAATGEPEGIGARFEQFVARGLERADKGKVWTAAEGGPATS